MLCLSNWIDRSFSNIVANTALVKRVFNFSNPNALSYFKLCHHQSVASCGRTCNLDKAKEAGAITTNHQWEGCLQLWNRQKGNPSPTPKHPWGSWCGVRANTSLLFRPSVIPLDHTSRSQEEIHLLYWHHTCLFFFFLRGIGKFHLISKSRHVYLKEVVRKFKMKFQISKRMKII